MKAVKRAHTGRPRNYDKVGTLSGKKKDVKEKRRSVVNNVIEFIPPKPGELIKTSDAICSHCIYYSIMSGGTFNMCDYTLKTGKNRGCKYGECDKFCDNISHKKKHNFGYIPDTPGSKYFA